MSTTPLGETLLTSTGGLPNEVSSGTKALRHEVMLGKAGAADGLGLGGADVGRGVASTMACARASSMSTIS